jgi:hypothetical protein
LTWPFPFIPGKKAASSKIVLFWFRSPGMPTLERGGGVERELGTNGRGSVEVIVVLRMPTFRLGNKKITQPQP